MDFLIGTKCDSQLWGELDYYLGSFRANSKSPVVPIIKSSLVLCYGSIFKGSSADRKALLLNPDTEMCSSRGDALFIAVWAKDPSVGILVSCYTFNMALLPPGILEEDSEWV